MIPKHIRKRQTARALNLWHHTQMRKPLPAVDAAASNPADRAAIPPPNNSDPARSSTADPAPLTHIQVCAIPDCHVQIPPGLLMCTHHWCQVPTHLQRAVHATWHALKTADDAHRAGPCVTAFPLPRGEGQGEGQTDYSDLADAYLDARARAISAVTEAGL